MRPYNIGMTPQFRSALDSLDRQARSEVIDAAMKVVDGYASTHVHKLEDTGFVAFGVNRNALRVVCDRDGDTLILLHVDAHDPAYDWAKRHRTVRVGKVVRFLSLEAEDATTEAAVSDAQIPDGPLAQVRDRVFERFDIGAHGARALRRAATVDELIELAEHMRPAVGEAVIGLVTDPDDLQGHVRRFQDAKARAAEAASEPEPAPLSDVMREPVNAGAVWLPRSARELRAAMEGELDDWRVFLHPAQQALVRKRLGGAGKVTGGPGTGKTVVALHRARFLAEEALADDPRPVLLTTFSRALTEQLVGMVQRVCADAPELVERLQVRSLVAVCQDLLREAGEPHALASKAIVDDAWAKALALDRLGWSRRDYEGEREHVVARNGAWSATQYLTTTRRGRSKRVDSRKQRREVWAVLEAFDAALAEAGAGDAMALARQATRAVARGEVEPPYSAVVCDEVQDASASQLRLLAALTRDPGTGTIRPDALFLCGDGYQRLYAAPVTLVSCGIEVRGRARRLRLNYRTTEGIRRAAIEVVKGMDPDELESLSEAEDTPFDGYRSVRGGPPPVVRRFDDRDGEVDFIAQQAGADEQPLLVLARTRDYRDQLCEGLARRGVSTHVLEGSGSVAPEGVTLCTLHRSKGLEAPRVIVAGRQLVPGRFPGGDRAQRNLFERQERCLLYVGMTRARDWCAVTSCPS